MDGRISTFGRLPASLARVADTQEQTRGTGMRNFVTAPLVGLVRNPRSHRNKGHDAVLAGRADVLLAEPRTRAELEQSLAHFVSAGIGMLAISGGDGTVRDVLTRGAPLFADKWPVISVLPQGKTNALALDLGIGSRPALDDAIAAAKRGQFVARRPIVVSDRDGAARDRWGFIFGAGVFNAAIDAGQVAHRFGAFQSFAIGVTAMFGMGQALFGFGRTLCCRFHHAAPVSAGHEASGRCRGRAADRLFHGRRAAPPRACPRARRSDGQTWSLTGAARHAPG